MSREISSLVDRPSGSLPDTLSGTPRGREQGSPLHLEDETLDAAVVE